MPQSATLLPASSRVIAWPSASYVASPFGSSLPNRAWSDVSRVYRYGFNGKEKDSETANDAYDFGARIYDGRLGRWLSLDPLSTNFPQFSGYNFSLNNPIVFIDPDGLSPKPRHLRRAEEKAVELQNQGFITQLIYNTQTGNYDISAYLYNYHKISFEDKSKQGLKIKRVLEFQKNVIVEKNVIDKFVDFIWRIEDKTEKLKGNATFKYGVIIEGPGTNADQSKLEDNGKYFKMKWEDVEFLFILDKHKLNDKNKGGLEDVSPPSSNQSKGMEKIEQGNNGLEKIDEIDKVIEGMPKDTLIKEDMAYHKGKLMYRDSMKGKKGYIYHEERKIHPKL